MTSNASTVETAIDGHVGILRLNRPRAHNAINEQMMVEATAALAQFNADERIRAIVLSGNGKSFCAGFDLKEVAAKNYVTTPQWEAALMADFEFIMQFWYARKPTIAAVHGYCLGSGLELAVACDITVADSQAKLGEPEVKFGSSIVALVLPWMVGPKFAKELLLTGHDRISASRAAEIGLVNRVVQEGQHVEEALKLAHDIAAAAPLSVQLTKRAINRTMDRQGMREALLQAVETAANIESGTHPQHAEFKRLSAAEGNKAAATLRGV